MASPRSSATNPASNTMGGSARRSASNVRSWTGVSRAPAAGPSGAAPGGGTDTGDRTVIVGDCTEGVLHRPGTRAPLAHTGRMVLPAPSSTVQFAHAARTLAAEA